MAGKSHLDETIYYFGPSISNHVLSDLFHKSSSKMLMKEGMDPHAYRSSQLGDLWNTVWSYFLELWGTHLSLENHVFDDVNEELKSADAKYIIENFKPSSSNTMNETIDRSAMAQDWYGSLQLLPLKWNEHCHYGRRSSQLMLLLVHEVVCEGCTSRYWTQMSKNMRKKGTPWLL